MRRIKGYIDVNKILQDIGVFDKDIKKIINNPIIKCHYNIGNDILIEFNYNNETYFFKYKESSTPYNELIVFELATDFGLSCVKYDLAILLENEGVLTKNYKKKDSNYILGEQILSDYWIQYKQDSWDTAPHNNLDDIWDALEYRYQKHSNKNEIIERLMKKIASIFIFDIITCQADRHSLNWEVEERNNFIDIGPLYDNELIFTFEEKNQVSLTINDSSSGDLLTELKAFLKVSDKIFVDLLKEKLWIISEENLKSVFKRIEDKIGYVIPKGEKKYYLNRFNSHKEMLEKELIQYEISPGERDDQNERKNR